jgi:uncharacterized membrane protein
MYLWVIPMIYVVGSVVCGLVLPRIEQAYFAAYTHDVSVASAQAYLSAVASGMMALTGIVFSIAFIMVQFSAIAYSPRLVLWFARDRSLFHTLGAFVATFLYSLVTIAWVDRDGSGSVPLFSFILVAVLLIVSMLLFSRLVQWLGNLQITNVLRLIGDQGRVVINKMFQPLGDLGAVADGRAIEQERLGPATQSLNYLGDPRTITKFDIGGLVRQAQSVKGVIVLKCAVGDTLVKDTVLLRIHGADNRLSNDALMRAIHLDRQRTFEQDPKYAFRLLADVAIKALSPAINDPTTAVQTIDQIEDLLRRLCDRELDAGYARDANNDIRLIFPMPTWDDYLALAFDEIRQYGATSVQVMRRLRTALVDLIDSLPTKRADAVRHYLAHLDLVIEHSPLDTEDRAMARREDRQGLGLSRT